MLVKVGKRGFRKMSLFQEIVELAFTKLKDGPQSFNLHSPYRGTFYSMLVCTRTYTVALSSCFLCFVVLCLWFCVCVSGSVTPEHRSELSLGSTATDWQINCSVWQSVVTRWKTDSTRQSKQCSKQDWWLQLTWLWESVSRFFRE